MVKKAIFLFVLCIWHTNNIVCQNKCDTIIEVFGGYEGLSEFDIINFLGKNINYPETAIEDSVEGKITVRFRILEYGYTSEHEIIEGVREDLNNEVLRVARLIKFDKFTLNGELPIGICYQFTFTFSLSDEKATSSRRIKFRRR